MNDAWVRAIVAFPFGLVVGSFLTVVVDRVPKKESIVSPRSRCPQCGAEIRSRDNIPVLSWLLPRGSCRTCRTRSWRGTRCYLRTVTRGPCDGG